jgi:hypothetical protein
MEDLSSGVKQASRDLDYIKPIICWDLRSISLHGSRSSATLWSNPIPIGILIGKDSMLLAYWIIPTKVASTGIPFSSRLDISPNKYNFLRLENLSFVLPFSEE